MSRIASPMALGFALAVLGAALAFALADGATVLDFHAEPLGGVLASAGVVLVLGSALAPKAGGNPHPWGDVQGLRAVGGLVAVLGGVTAVTVLSLVAITQLGTDDKESVVAITSSAFGIISAVVGAYLGIRVSAQSANKVNEAAKSAAVAEHEVNLAKREMSAMEETVEAKDEGLAQEARAAGQLARKNAVERTLEPSRPRSER